MTRFLRLRDVLNRTGLSEEDVEWRLRVGRFPRSVRVGPRSPRWIEDEIDSWSDSREAAGCALYFVFNGVTGLMKIGVSADPCRRLRDLEFSSGMRLQEIGVLAGGEYLERPLHAALARHRVKGEWFKPTAELWNAARSPTHEKVRALLKEAQRGKALPSWERSLRAAIKEGRQKTARRSSVVRQLEPETAK